MRRALAALGAAVAVTACSRPALPTEQPDPGVVHIHGLDVDAEAGGLYIATHSGLFRVVEGRPAERVGDYWHDLTGFTVAGPGDLIASGHPDLRDDSLQRPDRPPLLGLVESSDHGRTWQETSLLGEVDFHALEAAHGQVFGADATSGAFMALEDRRTWETRSRPSLLDFAVNPEAPQTIICLTDTGLLLSADGGRTWEPSVAPPLAAVAWSNSGPVGLSADGEVLLGSADAADWQQLGDLGGAPEALHGDGLVLHAAATGRDVLRSLDGGVTWTVVLDPDDPEATATDSMRGSA